MSCSDKNCHEDHREEEVVEGMTEEEMERLKQQRRLKKKQDFQLYKTKYMPLLKFLKANGLKFKEAAVKKHSVHYFRVDQFKALIENKKNQIEKNETVKTLLQSWEKAFVYYQRYANQPHLKWPTELEESKKGSASKFASFRFNSSESSRSLGALILVAVIAVILFPLWPYELKYYIWKVCLWLLVAVCILIAVRWVVYLFMAMFGVSFWIFPRFFDNCSTIQSFQPVISVSKWEGSNFFSITTRIVILGLFIYYGSHMYLNPEEFKQNIDITKTIIDDIDGWGISKIKGEKNFSQSALTDYSKLLNETMKEAEESHGEHEETLEI